MYGVENVNMIYQYIQYFDITVYTVQYFMFMTAMNQHEWGIS